MKVNDGTWEGQNGLRNLFMMELKDVYSAENMLMKALREMSGYATSEELMTALDEHAVETGNQVARLEEVFQLMGEKPEAKTCEAMEGLIAEAREMADQLPAGMVRDAAIISAAQKVEHYEIASYGTLIAFAETLKERDAARVLKETLAEEKETDRMLTQIAESVVNSEAAGEEEE